MWWFHFRLLWIWIPRYFAESTTSRVWPCIVYGCVITVLLFVIFRTWHFLGWRWNSMSQSASHFCKLFKSSWSCMASAALLMSLYRAQSSAKSRTAEPSDTASGRSLMKSRNRNGPRTLPWGTPDWTGAVLEVTPSSNTCCVRPQGSPLSTREYCYGRHSNWSYIEGAYVVLYRTPSKSPGVLGLPGPGYRCSSQGPALSRWAGSRRIFVCGSHVERHGEFCAHPGVAWCCCILYVPASYMWLRWGSLGGNILPCSSLLS